MSKDEPFQPSGLFSKVARFVRSSAAGRPGTDAEMGGDEVSKQLLQEMIGRKRRNDFVREREFDMLRKLRQREAAGRELADQGDKPSFFHSSMPSRPDDRASTLKKIDEIEAQMSMQWRKPQRDRTAPPLSIQPMSDWGETTMGMPAPILPEVGATHYSAIAPIAPSMDYSTQVTVPAGLEVGAGAQAASTPAFIAAPLAEIVHDAELEEAAILFANGDDNGAEAGLLEILGPQGSRRHHPDTWLTLLDLYRATGQKERFENAAIEFVQRFDRSAPQWLSMPDVVGRMAAPAARPSGNGPPVDWSSPSSVGIQTVAALKAALVKAPQPWRLDWSGLKAIEPAAVEPLHKLFAAWAAQRVQLRFAGNEQLQLVLRTATVSGDKQVPADLWHLRLEALRVSREGDEFEMAALDFCVTYEVSPPAWSQAACGYRALEKSADPVTGKAMIGQVFRDSQPSVQPAGDSLMDSTTSQVSQTFSVELSGEIKGDAIELLEKLEAKMVGADVMLISCAKLIRVDFSAAGTMLNWVCAREVENRVVQFSDVNRLVASFFNVIGITEHARVVTRAD
jgi:ABC-type transporter Mla MlaB component